MDDERSMQQDGEGSTKPGSGLPVAARRLIHGTVALAAVVVAASIRDAIGWSAPELVAALGLAAGTAALEQFAVSLKHATETENFSLTDALWAAGLLLAPPSVLILAVVAGTLAGQLYRRYRPIKVAYNLSQFVLALSLAQLVYTLFGNPSELGPQAWLASVVGMTVYFAVNEGMIALVIGLVERLPFRKVFLLPAGLNVLHWAGNVTIGMLGALIWSTGPVGLPLLVAPMFLTYLAYRGWLENRREAQEAQERERMSLLYEAGKALYGPLDIALDYRGFLGLVTRIVGAESVELVTRGDSEVQVHDAERGLVRRAALGPEASPLAAHVEGQEGLVTYTARVNPTEDRGLLVIHRDRALSPAEASLVDSLAAQIHVRQQNHHQATHDALTGLPNRVLFQHRLTEALAQPGSPIAVMLMDLNHFKDINDTLGHHFGDQLLREIRPRLGAALRPGDTIARLGGDEFAVLLPNLSSPEDAETVAARLLEALDRPIVLDGLALDVSASVGIACSPEHGRDAETMLQRADVAMYMVKEKGTGFAMYDSEWDSHSPERLELLGQLRTAIHDQLVLQYQPKAALPGGEIEGVEALVRWEHPTRGLIMPNEFIPPAERTGLLTALTDRMLELALAQCARWRREGRRLHVAINLSPRNLVDLSLPDRVSDLLWQHRLPPSALQLEITEGTLMADPARAVEVLNRLSAIGVGISIDDFGTGYSSLGYLKRLPVQELKIDRSFVMNMHADANDETIVRSTIDLAHNLGLRVVAEGVEAEATWNSLVELGCDVAQGYYLARPMWAEDLTAWLDARDGAARRVSHATERVSPGAERVARAAHRVAGAT